MRTTTAAVRFIVHADDKLTAFLQLPFGPVAN